MYGVSVTYVSAIVTGVLTAAALAVWPWARAQGRFAVAGIATLLGWIAWHLLRDLTASFSEDDPRCMMDVCDLDERIARRAGVTSTRG